MEKPELIIIGCVLICFAGYLFYRWYVLRKKIIDILNTPTSKISSLLGATKGSGKMVEIKGKIIANDEILRSPHTNRECVYYHSTEKDKIRKIYQESGRHTKKTRIYFNTTADLKSDRVFYIDDTTGRIAIDPEGAEVDGQVVLKKLEPVGMGESSSWLGNMFEPCGEKIIGTLKEEQILPPNRYAYVIGELFVGKKGPFLASTPTKDKTFLISLKSEESLVGDGKKELNYLTLGWATFTTAGIILIGTALY